MPPSSSPVCCSARPAGGRNAPGGRADVVHGVGHSIPPCLTFSLHPTRARIRDSSAKDSTRKRSGSLSICPCFAPSDRGRWLWMSNNAAISRPWALGGFVLATGAPSPWWPELPRARLWTAIANPARSGVPLCSGIDSSRTFLKSEAFH